jgi:hypothetical protein
MKYLGTKYLVIQATKKEQNLTKFGDLKKIVLLFTTLDLQVNFTQTSISH